MRERERERESQDLKPYPTEDMSTIKSSQADSHIIV
jgi:hypothetical protein